MWASHFARCRILTFAGNILLRKVLSNYSLVCVHASQLILPRQQFDSNLQLMSHHSWHLAEGGPYRVGSVGRPVMICSVSTPLMLSQALHWPSRHQAEHILLNVWDKVVRQTSIVSGTLVRQSTVLDAQALGLTSLLWYYHPSNTKQDTRSVAMPMLQWQHNATEQACRSADQMQNRIAQRPGLDPAHHIS